MTKKREASIGMGVDILLTWARHSIGLGVDNEAKLLRVKNFGSKQKSLVNSRHFGP